jgi:BatD DUF11 like domain
MYCIKPKLHFFMLIFLLATGLLSGQALAAQITVSLDRNPVSLDESFKIYFTADDTPDSDPDFSPLEQDFDILNQSQSSSSSWVNGSFSKSIRWTVEVTAKKSGQLLIPAISFGNDASETLPVEVNQGGSKTDTAHANEDIFLEVTAEPEQPYVQSQVLYTIRLYRRVDIAQAELSEPELADAVIEKLGEDSNFNTVLNGVSYLVTERKYAIFPQKSGVMTIKPLALTAQVIVASQPDFRDFFGSRMTKTKRVLSNEVVLNVKPAPPEFKGREWLAAEKLELTQEWSGDTQQMKAGEPLTRTLTLRGIGTTVGQLPELNAVKTDATIKAYPDKPVLNEQKNPEGVTATRQEKIAFIPATVGKHILPAIDIPWFNIKTHKMEVASIPETEINVLGVSKNQADAKLPTKPLTAPTAPVTNPETSFPTQVKTSTDEHNIWLWISLFLALGWLATVVFFVLKHPKKQATEDNDNALFHHETNLKECVKKLKQACADNDPQAAKNALLIWGKLRFGVINLGMIADSCDARLRDEIVYLNQILYGKDKSEWSGKKLIQAFIENKAREKINGNDSSELEPLHRL